jgi:8-oxo-dGTP diphosphatase
VFRLERLHSATIPTIASTGTQMGESTAPRIIRPANIVAINESPKPKMPNIAAVTKDTTPKANGSTLIATTAAINTSTTLRNVFTLQKTPDGAKSCILSPSTLFFNSLSSSPAVPVVCAVIVDATGRVLLAQRPPHKHLGLKWEFPGGKVENGETPEHAIVREIREELGCVIRIERPLPRFTHQYPGALIEMIPFVCRLADDSGPPHPHEHTALTWVERETLPDYDLAPADWPVVKTWQ